jgi:hypothetical protein
MAAVASPAAEIPFRSAGVDDARAAWGSSAAIINVISIHDININFSNAPSRSKNASTDQTTANSLVRPGLVREFFWRHK